MQYKATSYKSNIYIYSILALIAIGFYIVSRFTALHADDFNYSFINSPEDLRDFNPIWSFFSVYTDNFAGVGRFIPHIMVAFFTDITGKAIFNIFSTIGFITFCYLISTIASNDRHTRLSLTLLSASITWLTMPGFFEGFLWMAGACNYLFVAIIVLLFYRALQSDTQHRAAWWSLPLWFMFGFITGWTNEGFIVGLSGATGIYYIFLHPGRLNRRRISMLSGLWLGTICLCLTPFNLSRFLAGHSAPKSIMQIVSQLGNSVLALDNIYVSFLLLVVITISIIFRFIPKANIRKFITDNIILILAWAISLAFVLFTGYENINSRTPSDIYALFILIIFTGYVYSGKIIRNTAVVCGIITLLSFIVIIPVCVRNYETHEDMRRQIQAGKTLVVVDNLKGNKFTSRYFYSSLFSMYRAPISQSLYPVRYYGGIPGTIILSTSIVDMLQSWTPGTKFMLDDDIGSLWIRNTGKPTPDKVRLHIRPLAADEMNIFERVIAPYFGRYSMTESETDDFVSAEILGEQWIVLRNYPYISDRIYDVTMIYD